MEIFNLKLIRKIITEAESLVDEDDKIVFITCNPKSRHDDLSYKAKWKHMMRTIYMLKHVSYKFCIMPEISDKGRLHLHGWIVVNDKARWILAMKQFRRLGISRFDDQKHKGKGLDYYKKDIETTMQILPDMHYPVTYDTIDDIWWNLHKKKVPKMKKIEYKPRNIEEMFGRYIK